MSPLTYKVINLHFFKHCGTLNSHLFLNNLTNAFSTVSIIDIILLKAFKVQIHPPNPHIVKKVTWIPLIFYWIKCNTDEVSIGTPSIMTCGSNVQGS